MSLINIKDLTFSYDTNYELIFDNVSFRLDSSWKLGLIGKNGKGKTTLLNLLLNKYEYKGKIESNLAFEYFPLEIIDKNDLTINIIEDYLPIIELWQIKKEMNLLELEEDILYQYFSSLSNGEQTKVMLLILFLKENSFLLIDEPTNHLDIRGREIVSDYLKSKTGFILVSHDRQFLNNCIDHIMSINNYKIDIQQGNYETWKTNKDNQDNFELMQNEKLKKDIKRLDLASKRTSSWSNVIEKRKHRGKNNGNKKLDQGVKPDKGHIGAMAAKMMKKAKSTEQRRDKALNEKKGLLKEVDVIENLSISYLKHHNKKLVELSGVTICYDNRVIVNDLSFTIEQGSRVALVGKNGSGKSSIIKLINGENIDFSGTLNKASNLKISYVIQDTSILKGNLADFITDNNIDEVKFKSILRKLGFSRNQFTKDIEEYSAGQKKKIVIAKSLCEEAHLYIWDEALNYLDIISRIQLENLILEYQPTLLFVEHDQEFLANIATEIVDLD
ncbi:lincosamide and streptogramin A transport system ATP-binding/permease protein [Bacilli bacterium PM5-9]|nr:lincosamide and streptogramin A transport system ATP-binding/permease protein [Bacilli bacterium PM5-9]